MKTNNYADIEIGDMIIHYGIHRTMVGLVDFNKDESLSCGSRIRYQPQICLNYVKGKGGPTLDGHLLLGKNDEFENFGPISFDEFMIKYPEYFI